MSNHIRQVRHGAVTGATKVGQAGVSVLKDFKDFINRGNVVQIAVGIVVGTAFSALTKSFVDDIITPFLGMAGSTTTFGEKFYVLRHGKTTHQQYLTREEAKTDGAITFNWGTFIQVFINFIIVSACMFLLVKVAQQLYREKKKDNTKKCPYCLETVAKEALRCKFCTSEFPIPPALSEPLLKHDHEDGVGPSDKPMGR